MNETPPASNASDQLSQAKASLAVMAGGALVYTMASAFALRVLWKNLYAHASSTS